MFGGSSRIKSADASREAVERLKQSVETRYQSSTLVPPVSGTSSGTSSLRDRRRESMMMRSQPDSSLHPPPATSPMTVSPSAALTALASRRRSSIISSPSTPLPDLSSSTEHPRSIDDFPSSAASAPVTLSHKSHSTSTPKLSPTMPIVPPMNVIPEIQVIAPVLTSPSRNTAHRVDNFNKLFDANKSTDTTFASSFSREFSDLERSRSSSISSEADSSSDKFRMLQRRIESLDDQLRMVSRSNLHSTSNHHMSFPHFSANNDSVAALDQRVRQLEISVQRIEALLSSGQITQSMPSIQGTSHSCTNRFVELLCEGLSVLALPFRVCRSKK